MRTRLRLACTAVLPTATAARAEIDFLFGPDGTRKETIKLVKRGEKWYLLSF